MAEQTKPRDQAREPLLGETRPAAEPPFASIGDRLVAQLVDGLVAFGLFFFAGMILAPRFGGATRTGFDLTGGPAAVVLALVSVVLLAYFVLAEGSIGATLGKAVAGIRVQTPTGVRIGTRAALVRNLMRIIDGLGVYLVGAIAILATRRNQRLGDLAAGCVVVRRESSRAARVASLIVAIILAAGGVVGGFLLRPVGGFLLRPPERPAAEQAQPEQAPVAKAPVGRPRLAAVVLTDDRDSKVEKTAFSLDTQKIYLVFTLADEGVPGPVEIARAAPALITPPSPPSPASMPPGVAVTHGCRAAGAAAVRAPTRSSLTTAVSGRAWSSDRRGGPGADRGIPR